MLLRYRRQGQDEEGLHSAGGDTSRGRGIEILILLLHLILLLIFLLIVLLLQVEDEDKYQPVSDDPMSNLILEAIKNDDLRKMERAKR